jgi:hypothetical protein
MGKLFTQRSAPTFGELRYDIPEDVRSTLLAVLQDAVLECSGDFEVFLHEVGRTLFKRYGGLSQSGYIAARRSQNPVVKHFCYIHANPVKAGIAKSAKDYRWSSFRSFYSQSDQSLAVDQEWWWSDDAEKLSQAVKQMGWHR